MTKRSLKPLFLFLAVGVMAGLLASPLQAAGLRKLTAGKRLEGSVDSPTDVSVRSVNPTNPGLEPGGDPVTVTISGTGLNFVTGVQVIKDGAVSSGVIAEPSLDKRSPVSLPVRLSARDNAEEGSYTLRILAGSTINVPPEMAEIVVKAVVPAPAASASGSGPRTVTQTRRPGQLSRAAVSRQATPEDSTRTLVGTPGDESADGGGVVTSSAQRTDTRRLLRRSGSVGTAASSEVEFQPREAPENMGPRTLEGPSDLTSPEGMKWIRDQNTAGKVTWSIFNNAVKEALSGARFHSNSCGGTWKVRRITIDIPNTYYNDSTSLARLDYELTDKESDATEWTVERIGPDTQYKIKHIRACVDDWLGNAWTGRVEDGAFKIYLAHAADRNIKTRALANRKNVTPKWSSNAADGIIPDYNLGNPPLEITLTPAFNNGVLTYTSVDARWTGLFGEFSKPPRAQFKRLVGMILDYRAAKLEQIRQRVISLFTEPAVKRRISDALTAQVLDNQFVNRITGLTGGSGDTVAYKYE